MAVTSGGQSPIQEARARAQQLLVILKPQQRMGRPPAVGDDDRPLLGRRLGTAGILIELPARHGGDANRLSPVEPPCHHRRNWSVYCSNVATYSHSIVSQKHRTLYFRAFSEKDRQTTDISFVAHFRLAANVGAGPQKRAAHGVIDIKPYTRSACIAPIA